MNNGKIEDLTAVIEKYPVWSSYWEDHKCKLEKIKVPLYIVAIWTSKLPTEVLSILRRCVQAQKNDFVFITPMGGLVRLPTSVC